jgi:hypothetical protein
MPSATDGKSHLPEAEEMRDMFTTKCGGIIACAEASAMEACAGRIADEIGRRMPAVAVWCKGCLKKIILDEMGRT